MKVCRRALALILCVCLSVCGFCIPAHAGFGTVYSSIGGVLFYGGHMLEKIDFSAILHGGGTAQGPLFLCRVYDDPALAIDTGNYDRIANLEFICENPGVAVLSDYPGAAAAIDPGTYVLFSERGDLFDGMPFYAFTAKEYYQNALPGAAGFTPVRVGLPAFDDIAVTRAQGETVYTMQMTLDPELAAFYDAVNPDAQIEIACKYGYGKDDTFATIPARPASYDASSGVLTIELLSADGSVGAHLHNFCLDAEDYGYVFQFTYFPGLFTCGTAQSAHAFRQISGGAIEGMPRRVFAENDALGRLVTRISGKLWSDKPARRRAAFLLLLPLVVPLCIRLTRTVLDSARAFDGNTVDAGRDTLRQALEHILR